MPLNDKMDALELRRRRHQTRLQADARPIATRRGPRPRSSRHVFNKIKLWPEQFPEFLVNEVGFCFGRTVAVPSHSHQGFQRPLQIFFKPMPFSSRSASSRQTTPYFGPSPYFTPNSPFFPNYCYAPSLTPMYNDGGSPAMTPGEKTPSATPQHEPEEADKVETPDEEASRSPVAGPSNPRRHQEVDDDDTFSRPLDPPADPESPGPPYWGTTPNYSPAAATGHTPSYSGYTPGRSGITPGYTGPSPEYQPTFSPYYGSSSQHSPVYSGPEPGAISNASTPGHQPEEFVGPGYTPSYTPSNPGTPQYGHSTTPLYSPGNATPARRSGGNTPGRSTPSTSAGGSGASANPGPSGSSGSSQTKSSPQVQQCEVTGNTTPHPGHSPADGSDDNNDRNNPRYFWYGYSSSGGNTPTADPSSPASPRDPDSNPATPATPNSQLESPVASPSN